MVLAPLDEDVSLISATMFSLNRAAVVSTRSHSNVTLDDCSGASILVSMRETKGMLCVEAGPNHGVNAPPPETAAASAPLIAVSALLMAVVMLACCEAVPPLNVMTGVVGMLRSWCPGSLEIVGAVN